MVKGWSAGLAMWRWVALCLFRCLHAFLPFILWATDFIYRHGFNAITETAVNPYITLPGPAEAPPVIMSIMGICNKTAGILTVDHGQYYSEKFRPLLSELERLPYEQKVNY